MKSFIALGVVAAALCLSAGSASAALIDNPDYASWAKQKPGAKIEHETTMAMQGMNITMQITQVLKSIAPEKVVLEVTTAMNMGGFSNNQTSTREVPAKIEEAQQSLPPEMKGTTKKAGTGKVTAANQEFQCDIVEFTGESPAGATSGKIWRSEKVPGGVVQMESTVQTPQGAGTSKMILKSMTP